MDNDQVTELSTRVERLGWRRPECTGVHVVDLMLNRTVSDLIAALAENRDA